MNADLSGLVDFFTGTDNNQNNNAGSTTEPSAKEDVKLVGGKADLEELPSGEATDRAVDTVEVPETLLFSNDSTARGQLPYKRETAVRRDGVVLRTYTPLFNSVDIDDENQD